MSRELVSCIVPTYKRSDTLARAINSILSQTYKNIELIVVDDNNPNDNYSKKVQEVISSFNDRRINYIQQEKHKNGAVARNIGIKNSKGSYIAFLDDDDEWFPEKIEKQVEILSSLDKSYGAVTCLSEIYKNGELIRKDPAYSGGNLHREVLDRSVSIHTCTVLFRKSALEKSGYFDETLNRHQELQLFLDYFIDFNMYVLQEYLIKIHSDDGINRLDGAKLEELKKYFFERMKKHFDIYSKTESDLIKSMHYFEIALVYAREKAFLKVFIYLFKVGISVKAYKNLLNRYRKRRN